MSIIIPCLNEEKGIDLFLSRLQPLRSQCELILVDGGSQDLTMTRAKPFVDRIVIAEMGRAEQMNKGADVAQSSVLLFLHADTFLPDDALAQIQLAIDKGYQWGRFDVRLLGQHPLLPVISWSMNLRSALTHIVTGDQGLFVDKMLFFKVGQYQKIALMEDIALSKTLKAIATPYRIRSCIEASARRWLKFGIYKTIALMCWCRLQYFIGVDPSYLSQLYRRGQFWIR